MQPVRWRPPVGLSPLEAIMVRRIRRAELFVFLREQRYALFDTGFKQSWSPAVDRCRPGPAAHRAHG